jgi:enoyl-CoA hydratase
MSGEEQVEPNRDDGLLVDVTDGVAHLVLNRPHANNAPDRALHTRLSTIWGELGERSDVAAVVVTGAGRAFSAGADRALMRELLDDDAVRDEVLREAGEILLGMVTLEKPIIAAVNGAAAGLGCSIVAMCDLVVMAEDSSLLDPHVVVGLGGGDGIALTWPTLTGLLVAKEHALLCEPVSASRALELGLAHRVVPLEATVATATELALRLVRMPTQAVGASKRVLNAALRAHLERALPVALEAERVSLTTPENRATLETALRPRQRSG